MQMKYADLFGTGLIDVLPMQNTVGKKQKKERERARLHVELKLFCDLPCMTCRRGVDLGATRPRKWFERLALFLSFLVVLRD
jgi:hypothetical protein